MNTMLNDLNKMPKQELKSLLKRIYAFIGESHEFWTTYAKRLTHKEDIINEIMHFVVVGGYQPGQYYDDDYLMRIGATSVAELELKLTVMGF